MANKIGKVLDPGDDGILSLHDILQIDPVFSGGTPTNPDAGLAPLQGRAGDGPAPSSPSAPVGPPEPDTQEPDEIKALIDQLSSLTLPTPEKPSRSWWQVGAGVAGDSLTAAANVLAGGQAGQGAAARRWSQEQIDYEQRRAAVEITNTQLKTESIRDQIAALREQREATRRTQVQERNKLIEAVLDNPEAIKLLPADKSISELTDGQLMDLLRQTPSGNEVLAQRMREIGMVPVKTKDGRVEYIAGLGEGEMKAGVDPTTATMIAHQILSDKDFDTRGVDPEDWFSPEASIRKIIASRNKALDARDAHMLERSGRTGAGDRPNEDDRPLAEEISGSVRKELETWALSKTGTQTIGDAATKLTEADAVAFIEHEMRQAQSMVLAGQWPEAMIDHTRRTLENELRFLGRPDLGSIVQATLHPNFRMTSDLQSTLDKMKGAEGSAKKDLPNMYRDLLEAWSKREGAR